MKTKRLIAILLTAVCLCAFLAACGKTNPSEQQPTGEAPAFTTIGDAMALAAEGTAQNATYENAFVYVFEKDGTYWRLTAVLNEEQAAALWELDILDEDYDVKQKELVSESVGGLVPPFTSY